MKIKIDDLIKKYRVDCTTAINLDIGRRTETTFAEMMNLSGRGILIDEEQDIYTNDLPRDERKSALLEIFEFLNK